MIPGRIQIDHTNTKLILNKESWIVEYFDRVVVILICLVKFLQIIKVEIAAGITSKVRI